MKTLEEFARQVERMRLLEAYIPGSPYTLEWKQGYNAALDLVLAKLLKETRGSKVACRSSIGAENSF